MAIVLPAGGVVSQVAGTTLIIVPTSARPDTMQAANNNRSKGQTNLPSNIINPRQPLKNRRGRSHGGTRNNSGVSGPSFTALDNRITTLDNDFELLPDKSPWVTYAANIAGDWSLCANCQPDSGAKKLYRQYNFNRGLMGLPDVSAPIDDTEHSAMVSLVVGLKGYPPDTGAFWESGNQPLPTMTITAVIGNGLANPSTELTAGQFAIVQPPGSDFCNWAFQVATALGITPDTVSGPYSFYICQYMPDGAPGLRLLCAFLFTA